MWFLIFGQIFLVTGAVTAAYNPVCPLSDLVYPCFCDEDYLHVSISCEKIVMGPRLLEILNNTREQGISYAFYGSRLGDIPSDLFEGQQSNSLHFENCKIGSFGEKPFTGLENTLKSLYVYGSVDKRKQDLKMFPLGHLKKLEDLIFEANDIKGLGNDWFKDGPESLKELLLEANDIEELGDKAFASLINLQQIWLGDNRFKKVSRSMFPRPANKLELMEMSFNGIDVLPEDMFEDMPVLRTINVSGNRLKTVPIATWGKIWDQLDEVYLERNVGFTCDENIKWIYQRSLPKIFTGKCDSSGKFSGKDLNALTLKDFE